MAYSLRHPDFGYAVEVGSEGRRDVFLQRGFVLEEGADEAPAAPKVTPRTRKPKTEDPSDD